MSVSPALKTFFRSEKFGVVGASKDPAKFGNKVFKWYSAHNLPVTPVHPKETEIESIPTVKDVAELEEPSKTSLSFITPPAVTLPAVKRALLELHFANVWLQPGAESPEFTEWLKEQSTDVQDKVVFGGPCILVSGQALAKEQGKL